MTDNVDTPDPSRRDFMRSCSQILLGVTVVGAVAPALESCEISTVKQSDVPTDYDVSSLLADNQALVTATNGPEGSRLLIVRKSATEYTVLSMRCTHEGCTVDPPSGAIINCPCHGSQYNLTGGVKRGPSTRPLSSYPNTYDAAAGKIKVTFT